MPYVRQPEELVPGKPLFYATAMPFAGSGVGLLVESHEGRPTKIEGNPDHPSSRGATDLFAQAAILGLYDPDRSQALTNLGEIRPFSAFAAAMRRCSTAQQATQGAGIRILTETVASPTLGGADRRGPRRGSRRRSGCSGSRSAATTPAKAAGSPSANTSTPQYSIEKADVILSLDADFLCTGRGR